MLSQGYILKWSIIPVTCINCYNGFVGGWLVSGVSVLWLVEKESRRESWCASRKSALHWLWRCWKGRVSLHLFCLEHRNVYFLHACTILHSLLSSRRNNGSLDGRLANGERWELGPDYWTIWLILLWERPAGCTLFLNHFISIKLLRKIVHPVGLSHKFVSRCMVQKM